MDNNGGHHIKNMVFDLSPFFLFEAAGDSEGDLDHHNHHHNMMMMMGIGIGMGGHDNEDDAQSCSYDVWDAHHVDALSHNVSEGHEACTATHRGTNMVHHHDHRNHYHHGVIDDDDYEYDGKLFKDSNEGMKKSSKKASNSGEDYRCTSEIISTANSNSSRKSCVDSSEGKKLSEKERSRLFWETCLAS